jgi:hypothetical protein
MPSVSLLYCPAPLGRGVECHPNTNAMPASRHHIALVAVALLSAFAQALSAQDGAKALAIDGALGGGHGWRGGERVDRGLITGDLLVATRVAGNTGQGFVLGAEVSRYWQVNGDLLCLAAPDGGCIPQYPGFGALNAVVGFQWQCLRILGGPGYYTAYFDRHTTSSHSLGVGARTDVAVRLLQNISAIVVARAAWVPRVRGQSYAPSAVMIGLRLNTGG